MTVASGVTKDEIKEQIRPTLDNVSVDGLRAWLRSVELSDAARGREAVTELIADQIARGKLTEPALEKALIGFEESSEMRIYLFRIEEVPAAPAESWMPSRLSDFDIPLTEQRAFAGDRAKPMSPVYGQIEGGLVRVKWAEEQREWKFNRDTSQFDPKPKRKRVVLIADFLAGVAELRLNPPENADGHGYTDQFGRVTADAYYNAYIRKAEDLLGCKLLPIDLRTVVRRLVAEENPRIVRIHLDNHTNQTNYKTRTSGARADVRDSPDWRLAYEQSGETWAWDDQSFHWLPKVSCDFLHREVFTQINADEAFVKVNAHCSEDEVSYVVSQIKAREAA